VGQADVLLGVQVGNGAGEFQDAVVGAGGQAELRDGGARCF